MPAIQQSKSFFRRRRFLFLFFSLCALVFFFGVPWELPASLKDTGFPSLNRANAASLARKKVDEIYGLIHLVTQDQLVLTADPSAPVELNLYAAETLDWKDRAAELNKEFPIVVFSKTYCPYSKRAKKLLSRYDIKPEPKIIEVDLREDGAAIKVLLTRLTGQSTFPNIIVRGKSIGGSDDLQLLHYGGSLMPILEEAGAVVTFAGDEK